MSWAQQQQHALGQLLLTCVPCWASHFLVGMAFWGSTRDSAEGLHGAEDPPIRCFEASHVGQIELFWVLLPEPVVSNQGFHWVWRGWYLCLLSVQAQKVLYARWLRLGG